MIPAHPSDTEQRDYFRQLAAKCGVEIDDWFEMELISSPISGRVSLRITVPVPQEALIAKEPADAQP
jgi:hypothetical protein